MCINQEPLANENGRRCMCPQGWPACSSTSRQSPAQVIHVVKNDPRPVRAERRENGLSMTRTPTEIHQTCCGVNLWPSFLAGVLPRSLVARAALQGVGLSVWSKFWINLRSSPETDLADRFPLHAVVKWIGNSEPIAKRH
jgi:hypothetical protein